jgi:ELWxxDGT repeat protein
MKTSSLRRWSETLRTAQRAGAGSRARRRRQLLDPELLEDRITLSLTPELVLDIGTDTLASNPAHVVAVGSTAYFIADDGVNGPELWKSDGTATGTALVKDIYPGTHREYDSTGRWSYVPNGSAPDGLTNVNGILFFTADDGVHGRELWKSDGTAAGTVLVKDIKPGSGGSFVYAGWDFSVTLTAVNGTLFFVADDGVHGLELWKSDGTAAGTVMVKDINSGSGGTPLENLTAVNGTLFFTSDYGHGFELWKSNGTNSGTVMVSASAWGPNKLTNVNGTLFFVAYDDTHGMELWKSDGTAAGTTLVKDIYPGSYIGPYGGYYVASSSPSDLTNVNGTLFFTANDGTHGVELWKSDGTAAGTVLVKDILSGAVSSYPSELANVNGTLFFAATDGSHARELWRSSGTAAGTALIQDINTHTSGSNPSSLTDVNGTLFFSAHDTTNGWELWKSDGTAAGTSLVKDINPGGAHSFPENLTNVNGTLFFTARDSTHGIELWKSNGTAAGTVLVKDINPGGANGYLSNLTAVNGTLYFTADDGANGTELWKSDGTITGTTLVKDIYPGQTLVYDYYSWPRWHYVTNSSNPRNLTNVNGTLFFNCDDGAHGQELWKSDGTAAGTVMVKDICPGTASSQPGNLANVNGTLFFTASDGTTGVELWKSNGTAAGTVLVKDINPGSASSYPSELTNLNGTLFFRAYDAIHGEELWKSDGTAAGTILVKDFRPGNIAFGPRSLINVNGTLFFTAFEEIHGHELWKLVDDAVPPPPALSINDVTVTEGNSGTTTANFTVTLSAASTATVTVAYATANGTALAPSDYASTSGTLTFAPGQTSQTITVPIVGDTRDEFHETFLVNLSNPANATIADAQGVGTIADNDPLPSLTINDLSIAEGNAGTTTFNFTVTLSAVSDKVVSVSYATANGTAAAGSDYTAASGTLTFNPGQTSKTVSVVVTGDTSVEPDETFLVNLSGATEATLVDAQGVGTIANDDSSAVSLRIGDVSVTEGNSGTTNATFTVSLSASSTLPVSVTYATANGTANAPGDYTAASGTLTFAPGQTSQTITVLVKGDRLGEPDETFFVNLSGATNATLDDGQGLGTILDDEPRISISDVTMTEGNSGTKSFVFTVSLSAVYDQAVTMSFKTVNGSAKTTNNDYLANTGTLTFNPGVTTMTITIVVQGDTKKESNEVCSVSIEVAQTGVSGK